MTSYRQIYTQQVFLYRRFVFCGFRGEREPKEANLCMGRGFGRGGIKQTNRSFFTQARTPSFIHFNKEKKKTVYMVGGRHFVVVAF
jgi:hypothetical protein